MNPLLQHSFSTPHGTFPFPDITTSDIREAIMRGIEDEDHEILAICNCKDKPTFSNTIVALTRSGRMLERATTLLFNLTSAATSDELDALANEMSPLLSEHSNNIMLNPGLYARVKHVKENADAQSLTEEDHMLLDRTYEGFERAGANLDEDGKQKFRQITKELSAATLKFSQNVLKETNAYSLHLTSEEELEGLPEIHRHAAAEAAKERGLDGWVITLHAPSYRPFMMYARSRELREKLYRAYNSICTKAGEHCNYPIVEQIVDLRRQLAQLLGYKDFATYALRRRMAQTPEHVMQLLNDLINHYETPAKAEVERIAQLAREMEGSDFELQPWDFSYYAHLLGKKLFDYDPDRLRPYFELSRVKKGVLGLATKLYGIHFKRNAEIPTFHKDVEAYDVRDRNGDFLAVLYLDFFPRSNKQGGAWMTSYRDEECLEPSSTEVTPGNSVRPHVSVTTNFTKPTPTTPALLTLDEVQTFLHEFGHALHGIFAMTHYAALSGTSVYWDFVELPSQFMENYAVEPEFLSTFAQHYQTGEPLPEKYIEQIRNHRNFNAAYACMRQVSFGLLDMAYYQLTSKLPLPVPQFEQQAWKEAQMLPPVSGTCMSVQFGHIMSGGYAAGYYSYKWAEVLDADAFALFKQEGIFNKDTAESFRRNILSRGGTEHPMMLYKRFRGQEPTIDALLKRDGIE